MNTLRILVLLNVALHFILVCCRKCPQYTRKKIKNKFKKLAANPQNRLRWKIIKGRGSNGIGHSSWDYDHGHSHTDGHNHHHHHSYEEKYPERVQFFEIQSHRINNDNRNNPSFCQELNFLATLTFEEIRLHYMGLRGQGIGGPLPPPLPPPPMSSGLRTNLAQWLPQLRKGNRRRTKRQLPNHVDHRDSTGKVEDQNTCGSCWAFAASHALTGVLHKAGYPLVDYSEQQLLDCVYDFDTCGTGGYSQDVYEYLKKNSLIKESNYKYYGVKGRCREESSNSVVTSWQYVPGCGWEAHRTCASAMKEMVAKHPVVIYMFANEAFTTYKKGVFNNQFCDPSKPNHAMVVVGYGSGSEGDYWIVKNSWGTQHGMKGYYKIRRGINLCGIESFALYPLVKGQNISVDCKVSKWDSWGRCTKTCGGGERTRYRHVIRHPSGGGTPCPHLEQTKKCNRKECPPLDATTPIGRAPPGSSRWNLQTWLQRRNN